jgi:DNA replication protein DnaC
MSTEIPTRETPAVCANMDCLQAYMMRESFILDTWTFGSGICPACEQRELAAARIAKDIQMQSFRRSKWAGMAMPFEADGQRTDRAKLPAANANAVLRWRYQPTGLVVTGETGLGKTRTLVEMLKETYIVWNHDVAFIRWTEFKMKVDRAHRYGGEGVDKVIRPYAKVAVLAIDDLAHGKFSDNNLACFFELLDSRTSNALPTHFTTQHSKESLRAALDKINPTTSDAIVRRMEDFNRLVEFHL